MEKNEKIKFKDLEKKEKIGFISVFLLLFLFIFIFLFTTNQKAFAFTVKDTPQQVLETGLFITADIEIEEDIYINNINNDYLLLCVNNLTIDYYRYSSDNVHRVPSSIPSSLIDGPYYNADLSFGPFVCYNYFATYGFQRNILITNDFRDLRTTLFDSQVYFNFYAPVPENSNSWMVGYNHNILSNYYYSTYNRTTDETSAYYDLGYDDGLDDGYNDGFLDGSSDPEAVSDYLRDNLSIDLETSVNGIKNELIGNMYYQNVFNERIYADDLNFTLQQGSNFVLDLQTNAIYIELNNLSALNSAYYDLFGRSINFEYRSGIIIVTRTYVTIYQLTDYLDRIYIHPGSINSGWCNASYSYGCSSIENATNSFKQLMYDIGIEYLDFTYVLETPNVYDLSNVDFDFFNYDKGFTDGEQHGLSIGFHQGQQAGIETMSGSWISNLFTGLGALFGIAIAPNITIGMIVMIPIVLALVPFVIGLATGRKRGD